MNTLPSSFSGSRVGIGISTKSRWGDLAETLQQLESRGYHLRHPLLVIDDGSTTPAPAGFFQRYSWVRLLRHETSRGYIARRNEIARLLDTPYILTLDDDAHLLKGSLDDAASYLDAHPRVGALAFNILCDEATVPNIPLSTEPFPVQRFVGCSHLLRRERFLELGGFRTEFVHYAEEAEFCARLMRQAGEIRYFPGVLVRHNQARTGRSSQRIAYFQGRNRTLLALWHFPSWALPLRLTTALVGTLALVPRNCYPRALAGYGAGLLAGLRYRRYRDPFTYQQYLHWRRLPWISQQHHNAEPAPRLHRPQANRSKPARRARPGPPSSARSN